jgi:hypothetical protein
MHRSIFAECYSGDFEYGKMDGHGTYVWSSGKTYRGKWVNDRLHGCGEFYWPNGSYFYGTYDSDQRNGDGVMVWSATQRYRGSWAFGLRHGYGESIEVSEDGKTMTVTGSVWDRDKVKRRIFSETVTIEGWRSVEEIEREAERKFVEEHTA